ncbi:YlbF family regulator, partial [Planococcus sp. SIMBA_143]
MAVNVYDQANALEDALRNSDEFQNMKDLYGKVNSNPESKQLFEEFREV